MRQRQNLLRIQVAHYPADHLRRAGGPPPRHGNSASGKGPFRGNLKGRGSGVPHFLTVFQALGF
jgi:hypothetical protein